MADPVQGRRVRIAKAIRDYLLHHPDAADSADGIAKWWLARLSAEVSVVEAEEALELLYGLGVVEKQTLPGGRVLYRASRSAGCRS